MSPSFARELRASQIPALNAGRFAAYGLTFVAICAVPSLAFAIVVIENRLQNGTAAALGFVHLLFVLIATAAMTLGVYRYRTSLKNPRRYVHGPDDLNERLVELLGEDFGGLSFNPSDIEVLIAIRAHGAAPSVVDQQGWTAIILPLGFLKLMESEPSMARALLFHALAHVEQKDTGMWPVAASFERTYWRWLLPWHIAAVAVTFGAMVVNQTAAIAANQAITQQLRDARRFNRDTYETELATAKAMDSAPGHTGSSFVALVEDHKHTIDLDLAEWVQWKREALRYPQAPSVLALYFITPSLGLLLLAGASLHRYRRASERMADLAAVANGEATGLVAALRTLTAGKSKARMGASTLQRIQWVEWPDKVPRSTAS